MKFTSFHPLILTLKPEETIATFEALGFERNHKISFTTKGQELTTICMKNADGFRVDVTGVTDLPQDQIIIRMNVADFDEAYDMLVAKGFRNVSGNNVVETRTNKSAMMVSPSGFAFDLCQHIKD